MPYAPASRTPAPRSAAPLPVAGALPRVLVMAGSTARAGTSVTAAILAASAAALGHTVCLLDAADGAQRALLGIPALADRPPGEPVHLSTTLSVATSSPETLAPTLATARAAADVVVVDAGSRLATVRGALDAAALAPGGARNPAAALLVVTSADPAALAAAYALVKSLAAPDLPVETVVIGADPLAAAAAFAHLDAGARQFLARPLRLAAAVPADPSLAVALGAGMTVHDAATGSPAAAALHPLAERTSPPAALGFATGALPARPPALASVFPSAVAR